MNIFRSIDDMLECGHAPSEHGESTLGYASDTQGNRKCYSCCAAEDIAYMREHGRITLYLVYDIVGGHQRGYKVTNWPNSLSFAVCMDMDDYARRPRHSRYGGGFGAQRTDVWFKDVDGFLWHGINRGDNQILRCRRIES